MNEAINDEVGIKYTGSMACKGCIYGAGEGGYKPESLSVCIDETGSFIYVRNEQLSAD